MIYIILGTRAQLIKMAPIIKIIESKNWPLKLIHTGQHKESIDEILRDFEITTPWNLLYDNKNEVKTIYHAFKWLFKLSFLIAVSPNSLISSQHDTDNNIILVHGDTFSTVIGAMLGKRLGIKVGHIESGLRSFNFLNPFPEELNRLITFSLMDIAFCPGEWAKENLKKYKCKKINTISNTLLDALAIALNTNITSNYPIPNSEYAVVSIHRFENIFIRNNLDLIINQIIETSKRCYLVFILHPATHKRLIKTGLIHKIQHNNNISIRHRTGYFNFVKLLAFSKFVITDGGSNQEELSYLNIPTFLMRKNTERPEGLGDNVFLGKLSNQSLFDFFSHLEKFSKKTSIYSHPYDSPSSIICEELNPTSSHI